MSPLPSILAGLAPIEPADGGTAVTWSMSRHNNLISRAMCLFINMDRMVGGQFEQGLSNMKNVVERHG